MSAITWGIVTATGRRVGAMTLGLVLAMACLATTAHADERAELRAELKGLETRVKEHRKEDDNRALKKDIQDIEAFYARVTDKSLRKKLVKLIGKVVSTNKSDHAPAVKEGLQALGRLQDEDGSRYVSRHLKQRNEDAVPPHLLTACVAAGQIGCDSLFRPLMKLFEDSKSMAVAGAAMNALGGFKHNKRYRARIMEDMIDSVWKQKPGSRPADRSGASGSVHYPYSYGGAGARWSSLSQELPKVLNKMTGQTIQTLEGWKDMLDEYKGKTKLLFSEVDAQE